MRAKVPLESSRPKRRDALIIASPVQPGKTIRASATTYRHDLEAAVDCQTANLIYCLSCDKCQEQYIGETEKTVTEVCPAQRIC